MLSLEDFRRTRVKTYDLARYSEFEEDRNKEGFIYLQTWWIAFKDGQYYLLLENQEYLSSDLEDLEAKLYNFTLQF